MIKSAKLKNKYLWSLFIVVLVVDLVLTFALFMLYTGSQISEATRYSTAQLEQVCASLDILYDSLSAKMNQILVSPEATAFFQSSQADRLQEAKLGIKLRSLRSSDPYLRYITLYNSSTGRFVSTTCAGDGGDLEVDQLFDRLGGSEFGCGLRSIGRDYNTQTIKEATVYTFVYSIRRRDGSADLIVLDVNDSYFNNTVNPIRIENYEQTLALVDSRDQVISTLSAQPGERSFSPEDGFSSLPFDPPAVQSGTGSFIHNEQGWRFTTCALAKVSG